MSTLNYISACEHQRWHLWIEQIAADGEALGGGAVPYRCRSWRHPGECCLWKGAQDFARISEAVESGENWVYCVLTFRKKKGQDWFYQYYRSYPMWMMLRKRLCRRHGKLPYIQTWERHIKGGLHVNLLIDSFTLANGCYRVKKWNRLKGKFEWRWHNDELREQATAVGFGPVHWAQPMRDGTGKSMAGYLSKLSRELVGAGKKNQIPFDAPPHFRRLRASRGLLPPVHKSGCTGNMVFWPMPEEFKRKKKGK